MRLACLMLSWLLAAGAAACGADVITPGASSGAAGSTSGGPLACNAPGDRCVSLDLPSCGPGAVPVARDCEDPGNRCCETAAGNGTCAQAHPIDLAEGTIAIEGDTSTAADEHPALTCDSHQVAFSLNQGQLYYRFGASAGTTYQITFTPSFYGFVYVFPAAVGCTASAIEAACSSEGDVGMISGIVNPHQTGHSSFQPATTEDFVLAVDGDTSTGPFVLTIAESTE